MNARRSAVIVLATINETLRHAKGMLRENTSDGFCERTTTSESDMSKDLTSVDRPARSLQFAEESVLKPS